MPLNQGGGWHFFLPFSELVFFGNTSKFSAEKAELSCFLDLEVEKIDQKLINGRKKNISSKKDGKNDI